MRASRTNNSGSFRTPAMRPTIPTEWCDFKTLQAFPSSSPLSLSSSPFQSVYHPFLRTHNSHVSFVWAVIRIPWQCTLPHWFPSSLPPPQGPPLHHTTCNLCCTTIRWGRKTRKFLEMAEMGFPKWCQETSTTSDPRAVSCLFPCSHSLPTVLVSLFPEPVSRSNEEEEKARNVPEISNLIAKQNLPTYWKVNGRTDRSGLNSRQEPHECYMGVRNGCRLNVA